MKLRHYNWEAICLFEKFLIVVNCTAYTSSPPAQTDEVRTAVHFTKTKVQLGLNKEPPASSSYVLHNEENHQNRRSLTDKEPSSTLTGLPTDMGSPGTIKMFF